MIQELARTNEYLLNYDWDRCQFCFRINNETNVTPYMLRKEDVSKIKLRRVGNSFSLHNGRETIWNYAKW